MNKKLTILCMALLFSCLFVGMGSKAFAAEKDIYQDIKLHDKYMELWEVTPENVNSLNQNFSGLLNKTKGIERLIVPYDGTITLEFLKSLTTNPNAPIYQGYAQLDISGSKEGYIFAATIEKNENGNVNIKGWYVDIDGKLLVPFEKEMSASSYEKIAAEKNIINQSNDGNSRASSSKRRSHHSSKSDSSSSDSSSSDSGSNESNSGNSRPSAPTPPSSGNSGITNPSPSNDITSGPTGE